MWYAGCWVKKKKKKKGSAAACQTLMDAVLALTAVAKVAIHSNVMIYLEFYQSQRCDALHKKGTFGKNATVGVGSD